MSPATVQVTREEYIRINQLKKEYNSKNNTRISDLILGPKQTNIGDISLKPKQDQQKEGCIPISYLKKIPFPILQAICKDISHESDNIDGMISYLSCIQVSTYSRKNILLIANSIWPEVKHKNVMNTRHKLITCT